MPTAGTKLYQGAETAHENEWLSTGQCHSKRQIGFRPADFDRHSLPGNCPLNEIILQVSGVENLSVFDGQQNVVLLNARALGWLGDVSYCYPPLRAVLHCRHMNSKF